MSFNNYLLNLANISNEIGYSLTYGYGNIAVTEINFLKTLIAKSEEMIPVLEAEACFNEAEELDREERSFQFWMKNLYGNENPITPTEEIMVKKANRLKRRKQNKKHHKADRYHGKCFEGRNEEGKRIYKDRYCRNPVSDKAYYHSALKVKAREQDYSHNLSEMKIKEEENYSVENITEDEERILDNHYAVEEMLPNFKEGKYIFLLSFWNGERYPEDSIDCINRFMGTKTHFGVKDIILDEQRRHFHLPKMETETVHGFEGISFKWDGYYEWDDEERGFIKFTFLYLN